MPKKPVAKKRGRPVTVGATMFVGIKLQPALVNLIDGWAARADGHVTRSEAIRRLVELGLKAKEKAR